VLPIWHVQEGTNVNQNEVIMLEETNFIGEQCIYLEIFFTVRVLSLVINHWM